MVRGKKTIFSAEVIEDELRKKKEIDNPETSKSKEDTIINPADLHEMILINRSPCSFVYKAVYRDQVVAVKLFESQKESEEIIEEDAEIRRGVFMLEIAVWRELGHPNITKFIGEIQNALGSNIRSEWSNDRIFYGIVTEFMAHETLKKHLQRNAKSKLPFKDVIALALDLAKGLEYLHSKNIVHRDVKTENLLLDENNVLKLADFACAIEEPGLKGLTLKVGTVRYMAPEVMEEKTYNRKCDVFSFGICLWEIYCCEEPYKELTPYELDAPYIMKKNRPPIPKRCPKSIAKIMTTCWETEPSRRPEMKEVVLLLENVKSSLDRPSCLRCWR